MRKSSLFIPGRNAMESTKATGVANLPIGRPLDQPLFVGQKFSLFSLLLHIVVLYQSIHHSINQGRSRALQPQIPLQQSVVKNDRYVLHRQSAPSSPVRSRAAFHSISAPMLHGQYTRVSSESLSGHRGRRATWDQGGQASARRPRPRSGCQESEGNMRQLAGAVEDDGKFSDRG